jgi:enolase
VPSGASTGSAEAHELRDGDASQYRGLGVTKAVANVNGEVAAAIEGMDAMDQKGLDQRLVELDGTAQLKRIGANGILGVSMATSRASASASRMPLYARIAEMCGNTAVQLPLPMVNILSGGLHAGRGMDVQDFLAIPARAGDMAEAIHLMSRVRSAAADVAAERGLPTLLADEGGLSPGLQSSRSWRWT